MELSNKDIERFMAKIKKSEDPNDCWIWTGWKGKGYGHFNIKGKHYRAHRISFLIANNYLPQDLNICHSCDNPSCVNPSHLWAGTHQDNMDDKCNKGRQARKLTAEQVIELKHLYATTTYSTYKLGKLFGINHKSVEYIINRTNTVSLQTTGNTTQATQAH